MVEQRRKPGWAFWLTVAVVGLVLYVASFGPACWLAVRTETADSDMFIAAYQPMWLAIGYDTPLISPALVAYAAAGLPKGVPLYVEGSGVEPNVIIYHY